jgi:hypothetical protein
MKLIAMRAVWCGLVGLLALPVACGGEPDDNGPTVTARGPLTLGDDMASASASQAGSGAQAQAETGTETIRSALGNGHGGDPKVFFLDYADGTKPQPANYDACMGAAAPKFTCTFAPTLAECQRQIQSYLDRWYADLNIIFTLTRPTSGKYYTEVVSSGGGSWCNVASNVAGVAPFLCKDLQGGVAYTFEGGASAKQTAVIIAQEQAHLLGLEHTTSPHDIMLPTICTDCDGFENDDVPVTGDRCDRATQNSYQMMLSAVGAWGGGPKPSAFGCMSDSAPPTILFVTPDNGTKTSSNDFSVKVDVRDDCAIAKVDITVMPEGLTASAKQPPYEWDLTGITGAQTITVVATDGSGKTGTATVAVTAPPSSRQDPGAMDGAGGCTVASGAFGAVGIVPSLAMLLLFTGHNRRSRRRRVNGELTAD